MNNIREISPCNNDGKFVYGYIVSKDSILAVRSFILVNVHYLIRHFNKIIQRRFNNIFFKIVNFLVPGNIIFYPPFILFLRFTKQ